MKHLENVRQLVEVLRASDTVHALHLSGPAGIGKTVQVSKVLKKMRVKFVTLNAFSTALNLFNVIADNPDSFIVIDDCSILLHEATALSIIKAATSPAAHETATVPKKGKTGLGKRIVRWGSTSVKASGGGQAEFRGKIIVITNDEIGGREAESYLSRCLTYSINFTVAERLALLKKAAKSRAQKAVYKYLVENQAFFDVNQLNFRTLELGTTLCLKKPKQWRALLKITLPSKDSKEDLARKLLTEGRSTMDAMREWRRITGMSEKSFFRVKATLDQLGNPERR